MRMTTIVLLFCVDAWLHGSWPNSPVHSRKNIMLQPYSRVGTNQEVPSSSPTPMMLLASLILVISLGTFPDVLLQEKFWESLVSTFQGGRSADPGFLDLASVLWISCQSVDEIPHIGDCSAALSTSVVFKGAWDTKWTGDHYFGPKDACGKTSLHKLWGSSSCILLSACRTTSACTETQSMQSIFSWHRPWTGPALLDFAVWLTKPDQKQQRT